MKQDTSNGSSDEPEHLKMARRDAQAAVEDLVRRYGIGALAPKGRDRGVIEADSGDERDAGISQDNEPSKRARLFVEAALESDPKKSEKLAEALIAYEKEYRLECRRRWLAAKRQSREPYERK